MSDRALSILVHAHSKVGKSTFAVTSPYPRLYLDVESAARFLPITAKYWDPSREEPPVADGTWDTCVVPVRDFETVTDVYKWLQTGRHQFKSLIVDSVSELQVRCMDKIAGRGQMQTQQWGELLRAMASLMRDFRDLTFHPTAPLEAVVLTAMTRNIDGMYKPSLQGQLATQMPYWFDVVGYLYPDQEANPDPSQPPIDVRRLLTRKHVQFEAGERCGGRLPAIIDNPNVETMLDTIFGPRQTD